MSVNWHWQSSWQVIALSPPSFPFLFSERRVESRTVEWKRAPEVRGGANFIDKGKETGSDGWWFVRFTCSLGHYCCRVSSSSCVGLLVQWKNRVKNWRFSQWNLLLKCPKSARNGGSHRWNVKYGPLGPFSVLLGPRTERVFPRGSIFISLSKLRIMGKNCTETEVNASATGFVCIQFRYKILHRSVNTKTRYIILFLMFIESIEFCNMYFLVLRHWSISWLILIVINLFNDTLLVEPVELFYNVYFIIHLWSQRRRNI